MHRCLAYLGALLVIFTVTISGSVLIGHVQPLPEPMAVLHLNEMCALPCWIGITPGKTRLGEARQIVADVYNHGRPLTFDPLHDAVDIVMPHGWTLYISLNYESAGADDVNHVINTIFISSFSDRTSLMQLGDVVNALGMPEGIDLGYGCCAGIHLLKQWARLSVPGVSPDESGFPPRYFDPSGPVNFIELFSGHDAYTMRQSDLPWQGFGLYHVVVVEPVG